MSNVRPKRVLLVTGMAGAGRTTALKSLEDLGWEVVDNLPLSLLDRLLDAPLPEGATDAQRPLAIGIDSRTRGFDAATIVRRVRRPRADDSYGVEILYLDAQATVLARRYSETRRRHPLALDRPFEDGLALERALTLPLREAADHLIDTGEFSAPDLQAEVRGRFAGSTGLVPTLVVTSFAYARGLPRDADLVFDMRFLQNPHWVPELKPGTGLDEAVAAHVAADPAYADALDRIASLLTLLIPRYAGEGKAYLTVAFGCTGGRHRSVHIAEAMGERLRGDGFSPTIRHRDLPPTHDATGEPGTNTLMSAAGNR